MMRAVVERGSGELLADLPGGPVIAKTGTAEFGDKPPLPTHAWMVAGRGDLAVAVFVERGESGLGDRRADPRAVPRNRAPMTTPTASARSSRSIRRAARCGAAGPRACWSSTSDGRILLFSDSDPGLPGLHWWITPGGGVEPGESDLEAAVRELAEETGLGRRRGGDPRTAGAPYVRHGYTEWWSSRTRCSSGSTSRRSTSTTPGTPRRSGSR